MMSEMTESSEAAVHDQATRGTQIPIAHKVWWQASLVIKWIRITEGTVFLFLQAKIKY